MPDERSASKKVKSRGSLGNFFDTSLSMALSSKISATPNPLDEKSSGSSTVDIMFLSRTAPVKGKKAKKVQHKEPTFALHHGMLKMNSTVHKGIVDDCQKIFQKEWQSPTTSKNYGAQLFVNNDAMFQTAENANDDSFDFDGDSDVKIILPSKDKGFKSIGKDGEKYNFFAFDLKAQLRQYRSMSVYANPNSPERMANMDRMVQIADQLRGIKDEASDAEHAKLMSLMQKTHISDYYRHNTKASAEVKYKSTLESASSILFIECLRKQIVPFTVRDFVHSSNYKLLFDSTKLSNAEDFQSNGTSSLNGYQLIEEESQSVVEEEDADEKNDHSVVCSVENFKVVSIDIRNKGIGNGRGLCLAESLKHCQALLTINISGNRLSDSTLAAILTAVYDHTMCMTFDVSDNEFGGKSLDSLLKCITREEASIEYLNVGKSNLEDDDVNKLCSALQSSNTSLHTLILHGNKIGNQEQDFSIIQPNRTSGLAALTELLLNSDTLTNLDLSNNSIRKLSFFEKFCDIFSSKEVQYLTTLNLSGNNLGDTDSQLLFKSLSNDRVRLTNLDMSTNGISSKGAIALSYIVSQPMSTLRHVNLKSNPIGTAGCFALIVAIRNCAIRQDLCNHKLERASPDTGVINGSPIMSTPSTNDSSIVLIEFDLSPAITRKDSSGIFNENMLSGTAGAHYTLALADPYEYAVAQILCQPSPIATLSSTYSLLSVLASNPLATISNAKYKDDRGVTNSLHVSKDKTLSVLVSPNRNRTNQNGNQPRMAIARNIVRNPANTYKSLQKNIIVDPKNARFRILDLIGFINTRVEALQGNTVTDSSKARIEVKGFLLEIFSKHLQFSEELISSVSDAVLAQLTALPTEQRSAPDVIFVIVAKVVHRHLFRNPDSSSRKQSDAKSTQNDKVRATNDAFMIDAVSVERHLRQIGYEDALKNLGTFYASNEYAMRMISEVEISSSSPTTAGQSSINNAANVYISEARFVQLLLLHMVDLYGYDLVSMSVTLKGVAAGSTAFILPRSGVLQFDLTVPPIVPSKQKVMTNAAFSFFLRSITGQPIVNQRDRLHSTMIPALTKDGVNLSSADSDFDKILFVLTSTTDRVLNLTCDQAEVLLTQMFATRVLPFADLAEKLLLQLVDSSHACAFLTRNFHFHELVAMSKRLGYLFKVLVGNATGHYDLDMSKPQDRLAGIRLAELNNFQQLKVRQLQIWPINTSQLGDNCLFRNCLVNGKHHPLNSDFFARIYHQSSSLSDTNGNTTSTGGGVNLNVRRIEFDFVSAIRPAALVSKSFKFLHSENLDTTDGKSSCPASDEVVAKISTSLFDNGGLEPGGTESASIYAQPKNFVDPRMILNRLLPRGNNDDGDDNDAYLKPSSVRKRNSKESNFVTKIKQFGIISGNASKYLDKKDESDGKAYEGGDGFDESDMLSEPSNAKSMSTTSHLNAMRLNTKRFSVISNTSDFNLSSVQSVDAKADKNQQKKLPNRRFAMIDKRGSSKSSQKKKKGIVFDPADELLAQKEMLAKSPHYQSWKSVCKSSYFTYMKLYKYILMRSASSLQLLEPSTSVSASESVATSTMASTTIGASSSDENSTTLGSNSSISGEPTATEADIKAAATFSLLDQPVIAAVDLDLLNGNKLHHPPTYNLTSFTQHLADQTAACCNFEEAIRKLEVVLMYKVFLNTAQVIAIMKLFQAKKAPMDVLVRCVCIMWDWIVNIEQFGAVLKEIGEENFDAFRLEIFHRLGVCNLWEFLPLEGVYEFDLAQNDHRETCKIGRYISYFKIIIDTPILVTVELMKIWLNGGNATFPRMGHCHFNFPAQK
eukprot:gene27035-35744_t